MSMRNAILLGGLIAAAGSASAQTPAAPSPSAEAAPRAFAAPIATVGKAEEPLPPSPVVEAPADPSASPGTDANFGIGRPATEAEIAAIDIDVMPDGTGLPDGHGSFAEGQALYAEKCAACHGEELEGIKETGAPALIGGRGSLATPKPVKTVESYWPYASTLYDYVHRAMPLTEPGSLTPDEVYALSAFILGRGGVIPESSTLDAAAMRQVVMPNADGFVSDPRPAKM